ncbi:MAG: hypothetical protein CME63_11235 [Halobacteriovoraceae bacterium]|nr:hypothetical protein [Halobacteriovoraceae bacterium]
MKSLSSFILFNLSLCFFPSFLYGQYGEEVSSSDLEEHTSMDAPKEIQKNFKREDFKPYMLDHFNEGCPTNSTCTKKMGKLYKNWSQTLSSLSQNKKMNEKLESYRREKGIPFEVWVTQTEKHNPELITWEGNCNYHNREGHQKIKIGVALIKNISDLNNLEEKNLIATRKIYRLGHGNKVIRYKVPQSDTPLYIAGDDLIYQRSENGIYYGLSINPEGHLGIIDTVSPPEFPKSMPCPKVLEEVKKDHPEDFEKEIYAGVYCQRIWNHSSKKMDTLLLGWSCD